MTLVVEAPAGADPDEGHELSDAQRRLWLLTELGHTVGTTLVMAVRLRGPLDVPALRAAFGEVVRRHGALRTAVVSGPGGPVGVRARDVEMAVRLVDLRGLGAVDAEQVRERLLGAHVQRPFDRSRPPALRVDLAMVGAHDHLAVIAADHIAVDGWSLGVLAQEVSALYRSYRAGSPARLPRPPVAMDPPPGGSGHADPGAPSWLDRVCAPSKDTLPVAPARTAGPPGSAAVHRVVLPPRLATALDEARRRQGASVFTAVLAAWAGVVHRLDRRRSMTVATLTSGRDDPERERVVGHLGNVVPLRLDMAPDDSLSELWRRVRETSAEALAHRAVPYELVAQRRRAAGATPVPAVCVSGMAPPPVLDLPELEVSLVHAPPGAARFDLTIEVGDPRTGLNVALHYDSNVLDDATVTVLGRYLRTALRELCQNPAAEIGRLTLGVAGREAAAANTEDASTLHGLFEQQVARTPDAVALSSGGQALTYRTLNERANRVAHALLGRGVGREDRVALHLPRGLDAATVQLGVLKAGAAWVPVDPADPPERRRLLMAEAGVRYVVSAAPAPPGDDLDSLVAEDLCRSEGRCDDPRLPAHPLQAAYLMFTSGSTGPPKAVVGLHGATVARLRWMWTAHPYGPGERASLRAAPVFVDAVAELFGPLLAGVPTEILDAESALDPRSLIATLSRAEVSRVLVVPTLLAALLEHLPADRLALPAVTHWTTSGERLQPALLDRLVQASPTARVLNLYGSTEVAGDATAAVLTPGLPITIGTPIAGAYVEVHDPAGFPLPELAVGELHVGGAVLARGYHADPSRTAARFVPTAAGGRAFRTGDLVRHGLAGLDFLGRCDAQLKIRGVRIEPGEVESALVGHPDVAEACVTAMPDGSGALGLIAHVVPVATADRARLAERVRGHARARLPAVAVPVVLISDDPLPRTRTGKLDRLALGRRDPDIPLRSEAPFDGPAEEAVAAAFDSLLPARCRGADSDFFELGGHSLLAVDLIERLADDLGARLTLRQLFDAPTVRGVAALVSAAAPQEGRPRERRLEARPDDWYRPFPLTAVQRAYWIGRDGALALGGVATHGYLEIAVDDPDVTRLEEAINVLVDRHHSLRTIVLPSGEQQVLRAVPRYRIPVRRAVAGDWDDVVSGVRAEMSHQVLPADQWPLFDVRLTCRADGVARLHVSLDALIADAHSAALLTDELALLYRRPDARLPELTVTFRDAVVAGLAAPRESDREHWQRRAAQLPDAPELPLTGHADGRTPVFRRRSRTLDPVTWQALQEGARRVGVTPTAVLLTAYAEALRAWARHPRFTLVLTLFHRPASHPDLSKVVGDFTALLPFAMDVPTGATFRTQVRRVHQRLWEDLDRDPAGGVEVLTQRAASGAARGFPVVFTSTLGLPVVGRDRERVAPLGTMVHSVSQTPQVYLDHQVGEGPDGLLLNWDAVDAQFPPGMLDEMLGAYVGLLTSLADGAARWDEPADQFVPAAQLGARTVESAEDQPGLRLPDLFSGALTAGPDRVAVMAGGVQISYRELARRAGNLGRRLTNVGVGPGVLVGVSAQKGWPQVVGVLAVTGIGGAYVPLDPDLPDARLVLLLQRTGATHVLADRRTAARLADLPPVAGGDVTVHDLEDAGPQAVRHPRYRRSDRDLAYVIYTSGSTGAPKGVMIDHRGAVNTVLDINRRFGVGDRDRVLGLSSLSFDLSVWDVFGTSAAGACLVLPDPDRTHDPAHWLQTASAGGVTVWNSVPALAGLAVDRAEAMRESGLEGLRLAMFSGDWIPVELGGRLRARASQVSVIGLGGATEASIWSVHHPLGDEPADGAAWTSVPYGRPLTGQHLTVVDAEGRQRPDWSAGELVIGGRGVALGYWREPGLTANRFVPFPPVPGVDGTRVYRTGDVARFRPGGVLEFLGREDGQVKINGFRVELAEIDRALALVEGVAQAATVVLGPQRGDRRLAAAVVGVEGSAVQPGEVRRALQAVLPSHQVPRRIAVLEGLPLGPNGKVDRRSLAVVLDGGPAADAGSVPDGPIRAPAELVEELSRMWAVVLDVPTVAPHENFFAAGGTSLVAVRLLTLVGDLFGVRIPMTRLLEHPTVAELAEAVADARGHEHPEGPASSGSTRGAELLADPAARHEPFPLTAVQQAYWMGRRSGLALGGVATHSYVELDVVELDADRLESAVNAVVARHEALRTVFRDDGNQQVLTQVPPYRVLRVPPGSPESAAALRGRMSHQVHDPARWPLFEIAVSGGDHGRPRLHVSVDLLIADAWSFRILQRDLLAAYHGQAAEEPPGCSFRDYVLAIERARADGAFRQARRYWEDRAGELPGPPALPQQHGLPDGDTGSAARFERFAHRLGAAAWEKLRRAAAVNEVTPSGLLCAALADVLAMWTQHPSFLLNLTTFDRRPLHDDVDGVVGDFTSTSLLAVDASGSTFRERARHLQAQVFQDLEHREFSGVEVLRLLRRDPARRTEVQAPVVFTSMLVPGQPAGAREVAPPAWDATVAYAISQTPQVRLDVQVSEHGGELFVTWDHLVDAFPDGLVRSMFDGYTRVIDALAGETDPAMDYWEVAPAWTS
ncbi:amino acid adenylation domain-containing protein [Modestobacter sp. I12A-02628]|uniref:Phenyloxazoline synthase MbtB n=1 Tax=Goekera deserti TaxID=2497753 RepID=A0A7K3WD71_9ACTN|nr:non-ribosomal peptide synthetase [Goekera deserti]MPQ96912.1 amino acid adenylation domain-containing protein [Goekera deserti]NDI46775.1 amino acid adenylation domain-containing protein [Goekera deserti]NEL54344.1 amino acid adenylation domain-containing protein [Goekera deserti]